MLSEFNLTFSNFLFVYIYHSQCLIIKIFWNPITLRIRCKIFKDKVRGKFNWLLNVLFSITFSFWRHPKRTMKLLEALIFCASIHILNEKRSKKESTKWCIDMFDVYIYMNYVCNLSSNKWKRHTSTRFTLIYDQYEL